MHRFGQGIDREGDIGVARDNLLTFYGLSGIGKTDLSKRLERWVNVELPTENGWGPPPANKVDATARIDLHDSAGQMNLLSALLTLRAAVGKLRARWPIFDLAFAAHAAAYERAGRPKDAKLAINRRLRDRVEADLDKKYPRSRSPAGSGKASPTMRTCRCATRRSTKRSTFNPAARCGKS